MPDIPDDMSQFEELGEVDPAGSIRVQVENTHYYRCGNLEIVAGSPEELKDLLNLSIENYSALTYFLDNMEE